MSNRESITIKDFGSGSRVFKSNYRPINRIAKTSGTNLKRSQLLFRLVKYFNPTSTLELGTNLGIATHALALANKKNTITTIEGCPNLKQFAEKQLQSHSVSNTNVINQEFDKALNLLSDQTFDLVFVDGNHSKDATIRYFKQLLNMVHNDSVIIFDDIHWSKDMSEAWEHIRTHKEVTVSIDTFYWGFILFRKEQVKEHFTIRL